MLPASTTPWVWATAGVVRIITGSRVFSERLKANRVMAQASAGVDGSSTGSMHMRARWR
jgi:hypothetical protein